MLALLGALAVPAVLVSAMPRAVAVPVALVAVLASLRAVRRELCRPGMRMEFLADGRVTADARPLDDVRLCWQGPLAILDARDGGRRLRLVGWPDVLDRGVRRELRLWALATRPARRPPSVAP
ncbi:hypothetical protein [Lysobacter humi (ex Lee et al. 2017)]